MEEFEGVAKDRVEGASESQTALSLPQARLSQADFLGTLFRALDEQGVRYCVLHSYERLPNELQSDLDIAAHPRDAIKLQFVFQILREKGYSPIQNLDYETKSHQFIFTWFEVLMLHYVVLDVIFEYRQGALLLAAGEKMVANRQRRGDFWIPHPATEFAYLLAKKTLKGSVPPHQRERLKLLVIELGRNEAEQVAAGLFGKKWAPLVVDAAAQGLLEKLTPKLQTRIWLTNLRLNPLNQIRHLLNEARRSLGRWFHPTGLFIVILGPDGVGKSTLIAHLTKTFGPTFRRELVLHWRPMFFARRKYVGPITNPHGKPQHSTWRSLAHLFVYLLDYWSGYWWLVRPLLARSGLVVFDRYFQDMLVDPKRYRYGGPRLALRALNALVPKPDLALILDAPEKVILSRKQEVTLEEVQRQRRRYLQDFIAFRYSCLIDASQSVSQTNADAARTVSDYLALRFQQRQTHQLILREKRKYGTRLWGSFRDHSNEIVLQQALNEFTRYPAKHLRALPDRSCLTNGTAPAVASQIRSTKQELAPEVNARTYRFVVLPSRRSPRWLLPLSDKQITMKALEIYTPYQPTARLLKELLLRVISIGWRGWPSHKVSVEASKSLLLEKLIGEVTGERRPVFALSLGTPGCYRKLTIQVMRRDGDVLGYVKLPLTEAATRRVRRETEVLGCLSHFSPLRPHIPRVLYAGKWADGQILFQSPGPSRPGPVKFGTLHEEFLRTLWSVHCVEKPGDAVVEEVSRHWGTVQQHIDAKWKELGEKALERAKKDLAGRQVRCGVSHGDFAPWNTHVEEDRLFVHDWESAIWEAPLEWDRLHFQVQVSSLLGKANGLGAHLERPPDERAVFLLYLLDSLCRTLKERASLEYKGVKFRKELITAALG